VVLFALCASAAGVLRRPRRCALPPEGGGIQIRPSILLRKKIGDSVSLSNYFPSIRSPATSTR
jgi:hypothetical protein